MQRARLAATNGGRGMPNAGAEPGGQMQAGLRLGSGLLGAMQQNPGQRMGGLIGRAMLDPGMMQAMQQMGQGWGRPGAQPGMPNMGAMGPGGRLGGRI